MIDGGIRFLREKFDFIYKLENFELIFSDFVIIRKFKKIFNYREWNCLYLLSLGKCVSLLNFDLWLILKLLRKISGFIFFGIGLCIMFYGFSFEEDLVCIEFYCLFMYD